jgi:transposase
MTGQPKFWKRVPRQGFAEFMFKQPPAIVVMEACGGALLGAQDK